MNPVTFEAERVPLHFQLQGQVEGADRSFLLTPGRNRVGSLAARNEIVLPVHGVSRCHAEIEVGPEGVALRDLGSKNGTFVNGSQVSEVRLAAGDEVRVGAAVLRLLPVWEDGAELAIALEDELRSSGLSGIETDFDASRSEGAAADPVLDILQRLARRPEPDLRGALWSLVEGTGARGGLLARWQGGGEPGLLAAAGEVGSVGGDPRLRAFFSSLIARRFFAGSADTCFSGWTGEEDRCLCAALTLPGGNLIGAVLWGAAQTSESRRLARVFLRAVDAARLVPAGEEASGPPAGKPVPLRFPAGYVPGESPVMVSLYREMAAVAASGIPVLLLGETGVGKEPLARALHASSPRAARPFVAVNCAAIPAELLEAEMFGIEKGVATGVSGRPGKFEQAQGGTLFLDEVGDMPLPLQAKLLRVLQESEVTPVGGSPVPLDVRVAAATNGDLRRLAEEGRFRADLFYRLAGVTLAVPPLRRRRADLPALVESLVRAFSHEAKKRVRGLTVRALERLVAYPWPGNVRELEHEVRRLVYLCPDGQPIDAAHLSEAIRHPPALPEDTEDSLLLEEHVARVERRLILLALERSAGNRTQAAKLLGISRNGLAIKMERLGLPS
jgi:two-component system NtrC family response regulator